MERIVRSVREIEAAERLVYESVLGQHLREDQQIIIRVVTPGVVPSEEVRQAALSHAAEIARQGRANAAAQGIAEDEIDAAITEATSHARARRQS